MTYSSGILIENMRREGFEFEIGPPKVITKEIDGKKCEPFEEAIVEVPDTSIGSVVEIFAQRKGEMIDLAPFVEGSSRAKFRIATRGLLGLRNALLTATRGMAIMVNIIMSCSIWIFVDLNVSSTFCPAAEHHLPRVRSLCWRDQHARQWVPGRP